MKLKFMLFFFLPLPSIYCTWAQLNAQSQLKCWGCTHREKKEIKHKKITVNLFIANSHSILTNAIGLCTQFCCEPHTKRPDDVRMSCCRFDTVKIDHKLSTSWSPCWSHEIVHHWTFSRKHSKFATSHLSHALIVLAPRSHLRMLIIR